MHRAGSKCNVSGLHASSMCALRGTPYVRSRGGGGEDEGPDEPEDGGRQAE